MKKTLLIALVFLTKASFAGIVYTQVNETYTCDFDMSGTIQVDMNDDQMTDFTISVDCGGQFLYDYVSISGASANQVSIINGTNNAANYNVNDALGSDWANSGLLFSNDGQNDFGEFTQGGIIGVQFVVSGNTHYGWIRYTQSGPNRTVVDLAFNDVPDEAILAGQTTGTVGLQDEKPEFNASLQYGQDVLTLASAERMTAITIYSALGQVVYADQLTSDKVNLNITGLPKGTYALEVLFTDNRTATKSFVKPL